MFSNLLMTISSLLKECGLFDCLTSDPERSSLLYAFLNSLILFFYYLLFILFTFIVFTHSQITKSFLLLFSCSCTVCLGIKIFKYQQAIFSSFLFHLSTFHRMCVSFSSFTAFIKCKHRLNSDSLKGCT